MAGQSIPGFALPVYSKMNNKWPSLNVSKPILVKNLIELRNNPWVALKNPATQTTFWEQEENLYNPTHVSRWAYLKPTAQLRRFPNESSLPIKQTQTKGYWLILQHSSHWVQVTQFENKSRYWVEASQLNAAGKNWDYAVTKNSTSLYSQADFTGKKMCHVASHERLTVYSFSGHFARVSSCGGSGYVPLKDLITKAHFAKYVTTSDGPHEVLRINTSEVIDTNLRPVSFSSILEFVFHPDLRISKSSEFAAIQKLYVLQTRNIVWGLSEVPKAGLFWWNTGLKETEKEPGLELPTKDLIKRKFFDIVTSPINPKEKWASANGIYRTIDGKTWQKVSQFENNDYPIFISKSGRIFVGPYFSDDDGETFSSYVKWDLLLKLLNNKYHAHLNDIRLSRIESLDFTGDTLKLIFHVANQYLSIETKDFGNSWQLLKK